MHKKEETSKIKCWNSSGVSMNKYLELDYTNWRFLHTSNFQIGENKTIQNLQVRNWILSTLNSVEWKKFDHAREVVSSIESVWLI